MYIHIPGILTTKFIQVNAYHNKTDTILRLRYNRWCFLLIWIIWNPSENTQQLP